MNLESVGILISLRPFNERDSVAHIFTRDNGVLVGMLRGAVVARTNRPTVGQIGNVAWNARLDSQLGVFHWDVISNPIASAIFVRDKLLKLNAMFALIDKLLPEREQYEHLYNVTITTIDKIITDSDINAYLQWEIALLHDLGYALDLTRCSGCGRRDNLNFLSPRTGRAVCDNCARPYMNQVYKLPLNLAITARFINAVAIAQGTELPHARKMLVL